MIVCREVNQIERRGTFLTKKVRGRGVLIVRKEKENEVDLTASKTSESFLHCGPIKN